VKSGSSEQSDHRRDFAKEIADKERRKLRARRERGKNVWFGLGMLGLIGWSVSIPVLAGIAVGVWLDSRSGASISWTLVGLGCGFALGCVNAWFWISRERKAMEKREEDE